ncbi:hypothetical protein D7Z54_11705 [Salibacterium salarium]|uniref:Uncharacterized protein n=1 Tax=Salibacterium salarium TaxID=284579 RepID=A0A3R9QLZ5_9BACI|nr:hypothetical protein [Salibacterium salarium]RSL33282.1 hypothetical protein D7Z54_11705 [Salibacterium salarium]
MILDESTYFEETTGRATEPVFSLLKPEPLLDHHPTLGWTLKNKNETVAIGVKIEKYAEKS